MMKNTLTLILVLTCLLIAPLNSPTMAEDDSFTVRPVAIDSLMPVARLSPDGALIAVFHHANVQESSVLDRYIWLIDADTGDEVTTLTEATTTISDAAFSADGGRLVAAQTNGDIHLWDTDSGALINTFLMPFYGGVRDLRFMPDDREIVFVFGQPDQIMFMDTETGYITRILAPRFDTVEAIAEAMSDSMRNGNFFSGTALSPDGLTFGVALANEAVLLWDVTTREQIFIRADMGRPLLNVTGIAFSADGTRIVYTIPQNSELYLHDTANGLQIDTLPITADAFALTPDGEHLVWAQIEAASLFFAPLDAPDAAELLFEPPAELRLMPRQTVLQFSADGRRLLLSGMFNADGDNAIYLFERGG